MTSSPSGRGLVDPSLGALAFNVTELPDDVPSTETAVTTSAVIGHQVRSTHIPSTVPRRRDIVTVPRHHMSSEIFPDINLAAVASRESLVEPCTHAIATTSPGWPRSRPHPWEAPAVPTHSPVPPFPPGSPPCYRTRNRNAQGEGLPPECYLEFCRPRYNVFPPMEIVDHPSEPHGRTSTVLYCTTSTHPWVPRH